MAKFFAELRRRNLYRVGAVYAVVAWILLQLVNNLTPALRLPEWASSLVVILLMVGFPVALIFTWAHELPPETEAIPPAANTKLDWVLSSALVVVIALFIYQQFAPARPVTMEPSGVAAVRVPSAAQPAAFSVAVLPFVNLSSDPEQEFFSDGMTEEITSALAKVPGVIVIGRTSAFEFKGQNRDLRTIGQTLGTTHLIEGSVRKAGTRVRITAQLILAESGAHIWTENYDRELTDVFAIQENIAQAIAGALRVPLGLQQGGTLIANRTDDLNSYEQYLRARALYRARTEDQGISILESLVARNPGFAPAWGLLSQAYVRGTRGQGDNLLAEKAAREAIRLDPGNAPAYAALADVDSFFGRWSAGEDGFRRALALDPNEPDILHRYSSRLAVAGRFKESFSLREKLNTLEPFVPNYNVATARFMISTGRVEDAIAIIERVPLDADRTTVGRNVQLARAYAITGRYAEAADTLLATPPQSSVNRRSIEEAARLLRTAPRKADSPEALPELEDNLNFVYAYVGALDRVLDDPERRVASRSAIGPSLDILWQPESAPLRKTERFKRFARDAGLVDYWKARGWPDLCRPVGADDFVCD